MKRQVRCETILCSTGRGNRWTTERGSQRSQASSAGGIQFFNVRTSRFLHLINHFLIAAGAVNHRDASLRNTKDITLTGGNGVADFFGALRRQCASANQFAGLDQGADVLDAIAAMSGGTGDARFRDRVHPLNGGGGDLRRIGRFLRHQRTRCEQTQSERENRAVRQPHKGLQSGVWGSVDHFVKTKSSNI
jgi:hypothetical protein